VLAVAGVLSWFNLVFPQVLFLIPLVRFPGFIWLIATGFMLPNVVSQPVPVTEMRTNDAQIAVGPPRDALRS
jgi:hypothetical protein